MKTQKKSFYFFQKKKDYGLKFLFFLMFGLGIFALTGFILTSLWKYDFLAAEFFARGIKYDLVKYWTQTYLVIGETDMTAIFILMLMILLESLFKKKAEKNPQGFCAKNRWFLSGIYLLILTGWIAFNIYEIVHYPQEDMGFGPGVDQWVLDSIKFRQVGKIIAFLLHTSFLVFGSYYIHFKLVKKSTFWQEAYWIDAIKSISFFVVSFLLVGFLKSLLSRPYYFNCIFGDLMEELKANGHDDWVNNYLSQTKVKLGFYNPESGFWDANIPGEWPWYQANGYFKSAWDMPQYPLPINYAFPSGHVTATFCMGTVFFLFLGKQRKFSWWKKLLLVLFLLHLLSMTFALVTMRGHWISDLTFSQLWCLTLLPTVNLVVNKIFSKKKKVSKSRAFKK